MIYIIRHGQTELNQKRVMQGRSDYPLNDIGIEQAVKAAELLKDISFDHVFSSPLRRAIETAEIVAPNVNPVVDMRLIEMEYGPYEGIKLDALPEEVLAFFYDLAHNPAPKGMEQLPSIVKRTGEFMEEIKDLPGNTLIATHAIAMKGILEYLTPGSDGSYWSKHIKNCDVYTVYNANGKLSVPKELVRE